jgi:hypothetical protein
MNNQNLNSIFVPLRLTYGLIPILAGLDKYFNILTRWTDYLAPQVTGILGVNATTFMQIVGVVEIAVGILVLTQWVRLGAYVAAAWLVLVAGNLIMAGYLDVAVRDLAMAVGAYSLARLAEARQESRAEEPVLGRKLEMSA